MLLRLKVAVAYQIVESKLCSIDLRVLGFSSVVVK
jgi:hypothetical protein